MAVCSLYARSHVWFNRLLVPFVVIASHCPSPLAMPPCCAAQPTLDLCHPAVWPPPSPCGCCASAQIPHLSGIEASLGALRLRGLLRTLRMLALGLHDLMRSQLGLSAAYVRIVGRPTDAALMLLEEAEEKGYYAKHPPVKRVGVRCVAARRLLLLLEHEVLHCDRALASRVQFGLRGKYAHRVLLLFSAELSRNPISQGCLQQLHAPSNQCLAFPTCLVLLCCRAAGLPGHLQG